MRVDLKFGAAIGPAVTRGVASLSVGTIVCGDALRRRNMFARPEATDAPSSLVIARIGEREMRRSYLGRCSSYRAESNERSNVDNRPSETRVGGDSIFRVGRKFSRKLYRSLRIEVRDVEGTETRRKLAKTVEIAARLVAVDRREVWPNGQTESTRTVHYTRRTFKVKISRR